MLRSKDFERKRKRMKRLKQPIQETQSVLQVQSLYGIMADKLKAICDVAEDCQKQIAEMLPEAMEQATSGLREKLEELKRLEEYEHEQQDEG